MYRYIDRFEHNLRPQESLFQDRGCDSFYFFIYKVDNGSLTGVACIDTGSVLNTVEIKAAGQGAVSQRRLSEPKAMIDEIPNAEKG
jgi:hypothetical protein